LGLLKFIKLLADSDFRTNRNSKTQRVKYNQTLIVSAKGAFEMADREKKKVAKNALALGTPLSPATIRKHGHLIKIGLPRAQALERKKNTPLPGKIMKKLKGSG